MTDREMLEMAARAAGFRVVASVAEMHGCTDESTIYPGVMLAGVPNPWNPLTDDGDALRLAVKLKIDLYNYAPPVSEFEWVEAVDYTNKVANAVESYGSDPYAATRRAIVRAAAEIGRQMEGTT